MHAKFQFLFRLIRETCVIKIDYFKMYLNIVSRVLHEQMLFYFSFIGRILFLCNIIEKCWIERKNQITSRTLDIKEKLIFYCGWKTLDVIQDMQMNDKRRFKRWKSNFLPNGTKCSKTLDNLVNEKREKRAIKMILFRTCTKRTVRKCWEFSLNHRFMVYRFIIYIVVERAAAAKLTVGRHYRTSKEGCCSLSANYYTWRITVTMARLSRDYNA